MRLRLIRALALAALLPAVGAAARAGEKEKDNQKKDDGPRPVPVKGLELSLEKGKYQGRLPMRLPCRFRNASDRPLILAGKFSPVVNIFARDAAGQTFYIAAWEKATSVQKKGGLPLGLTVLHPGKSLWFSAYAWNWKRLPGNGTYTIWVEYRVDPVRVGSRAWAWSGSVCSQPRKVAITWMKKDNPANPKPKPDPKPEPKPKPPDPEPAKKPPPEKPDKPGKKPEPEKPQPPEEGSDEDF